MKGSRSLSQKMLEVSLKFRSLILKLRIGLSYPCDRPPCPGLVSVFGNEATSDESPACPPLSPGEVHSFEAMDSDPEQARTLDAQCPVSKLLQLKLGAQVRGKQGLGPGSLGLPTLCPSCDHSERPSSLPPLPTHLPVFSFPPPSCFNVRSSGQRCFG